MSQVPHEIGDFAILLRAGFSRWQAARAQLFTGAAGLAGALFAVTFSGADNSMGKYLILFSFLLLVVAAC